MGELKPYAYDLNSPSERARLWRELDGYLNTCERHHHGTDFAGRQFARQALQQLSGFGENVAPDPAVVALVRAARMALECVRYCRKRHSDPQSGEGFPAEIFIEDALAPFKHIEEERP